jgi:non-homologous end joining protein Ku
VQEKQIMNMSKAPLELAYRWSNQVNPTQYQYVVIEKQDFEKEAVENTRTINIQEFIDERELDPLFIEKSYCIAPDSIDNGEPY